ncbi:MAG: protocatechuate 3,4-dioxygenase [Rhodospirillales bacterium]|nr:protocatechuate 3,4-dioxygenase [Rhodospirillales bacterium]
MPATNRRRGPTYGRKFTLTRRALILAAPCLLLPAATRALAPTPTTGDGPFYPSRLPADIDSDLVKIEGAVREAGGDILSLAGTVLDGKGRLIAGARVEIWQCDVNGVYLESGSYGGRRDSGFQGFGHAIADAEGRFRFRTIVPVPYTGRTPHIHVKVLKGGREVLTSQLYRAGFPQNASDFLFRRLSAAERERVSMMLTPTTETKRPTFETKVTLVVDG